MTALLFREDAYRREAAALVLAGKPATVAGSDAPVMRAPLTKAGKAVRA